MRLATLACVGFLLFSLAAMAQEQPVQRAAFDSRPQVQAAAPDFIDVPADSLGSKYRLIGKLKQPLGEVVKVQGIVVATPRKVYGDEHSVRVFRIGKEANQEFIQLKLKDYYGRDEIPNLVVGRAFEFEGYETGGFVGVPEAALKLAGLVSHSSEHGFVHEFVVFESAEIKLQPFTPADFLGRDALLQGQAVSEGGSAYIAAGNWKLLVDNGTPWSKTIEGKTVEARGVIRTIGKSSTYRLENGGKANNARLVNLNDQLGRQVSLRGSLFGVGGQFVFRYRGTLVQVENLNELAVKLETTPSVQVTGVLEQQTVTETVSELTGETETRTYFIVRKATLKPTDALLAIERAEPVE